MERLSFVKTYNHVYLTHPTYPNCRIGDESPYDEQIMSMPMIGKQVVTHQKDTTMSVQSGTYFFFLFNLTNYFHFLYDTLPYLVHYKELLKTHSECTLLLPKDHTWMRFQTEMFALLGMTKFTFAKDNNIYETLFVPSSLTHGKTTGGQWASNMPPSPDAWSIWSAMPRHLSKERPKKIYISRRSWIHNDVSNIGTNYTTRRKCMNEDAVVELAKRHGYEEVFCELLSTEEKLAMFQQATHILGFIGGGMANCLFSPSTTSVGCIETPEFLTINQRFQHTMNHTHVTYLPITELFSYEGPYSLYVRVEIIDRSSSYYGKIGEIEEYTDGFYRVKVSNNDVAGFSHTTEFPLVTFHPVHLKPLDKGLNSPFQCDLRRLTDYLDKP